MKQPWEQILGRFRRRSAGVIRLCLKLLLLATATTWAQNSSPAADEYDIRAAMVINLTRFVVWPPARMDAHPSQILVCIAGPDPIGASLDHLLLNQTVGGRSIRLRHLESLQAAQACDVLYVGHQEQRNIRDAAPALAKAGVLLVSEKTNGDLPDQVIGLPTVDERVHIEVNLKTAKLAGLTISSRLLHLATVTR